MKEMDGDVEDGEGGGMKKTEEHRGGGTTRSEKRDEEEVCLQTIWTQSLIRNT